MPSAQVKNLTMYVKSRGLPSRYDYQWQSQTQQSSLESPEQQIPGIIKAELNSFCLILCRSSESLDLLVSGLPSGRKDIKHRNIRNTVMWKLDKPDDHDEASFRTLASMILRNEKIQIDKIDRSIQFSEDEKYGYSVNWSLLDPAQLISGEQLAKIGMASLVMEKLDYSSTNVDNIASKLINFSLPIHENNLVIVKDDKSQLVAADNKLCLTLGNISSQSIGLIEPEINSDTVGILQRLFDTLDYLNLNNLNPKIALFAIIGLLASGTVWATNQLGDTSAQATVKNIAINVMYSDNKPSVITYTLTGDLNAKGIQLIEEVSLIDPDKNKVSTSHRLNDKSGEWEIIYKQKLKIDCQRKLSIQGFDKNKEIGESIAIPSICM